MWNTCSSPFSLAPKEALYSHAPSFVPVVQLSLHTYYLMCCVTGCVLWRTRKWTGNPSFPPAACKFLISLWSSQELRRPISATLVRNSACLTWSRAQRKGNYTGRRGARAERRYLTHFPVISSLLQWKWCPPLVKSSYWALTILGAGSPATNQFWNSHSTERDW